MVSWSSDSSRIPPEQQIRDSLIRSMEANGATPSRFLELLDAVTKDGVWRKLTDRRGRTFDTFTHFVITERPEGLGLHGREDLKRHLALEHKEEREPYKRAATVQRMNEMRKRVNELLGDEIPEATRDEGRPVSNKGSTTPLITPRIREHNAASIIARLKRDDPELAQQVVSGELSPDAAARKKGWHKPRIVLSTPDRVAKRLRDHFKDPEQRALLAELLTKKEEN